MEANKYGKLLNTYHKREHAIDDWREYNAADITYEAYEKALVITTINRSSWNSSYDKTHVRVIEK